MSTSPSVESVEVFKEERAASSNESSNESHMDVESLTAPSLANLERIYTKQEEQIEWSWADDPNNPYNWPLWRKNYNVFMIAIQAFVG